MPTWHSSWSMRLTSLGLDGFRNLRDARLSLPANGIALIGRNAQGKTNFLEAIHYLETFRSFRRAHDEDLIGFDREHFRLSAELSEEQGGHRAVTAAFRPNPRTKRVTVDGDEMPRLGKAIGTLASILCTPDDIRLVRDGPGERRRFLDVVLSLNEPGYLTALQTFRSALSQRNAALRDGEGSALVSAWDSTLVRAGADVSWLRGRWVRQFSAAFGEFYGEVAAEEPAHMRYEPSVAGAEAMEEPSETANAYRVALLSSQRQDSRRRMTMIGPHRDDLTFSAAGPERRRDLREYGSGGERRTAALALRLLEAQTARIQRGREPILLLDDVFAELDEERSDRLLGLLDRLVPGQVILTAPKEADVKFRDDSLTRWRIDGGEIEG